MSDSAQPQPQSASSLAEIRAARLEKVEQMKALGFNPYAYQWRVTHQAEELQEKYINLEKGEEVEGEDDDKSIQVIFCNLLQKPNTNLL